LCFTVKFDSKIQTNFFQLPHTRGTRGRLPAEEKDFRQCSVSATKRLAWGRRQAAASRNTWNDLNKSSICPTTRSSSPKKGHLPTNYRDLPFGRSIRPRSFQFIAVNIFNLFKSVVSFLATTAVNICFNLFKPFESFLTTMGNCLSGAPAQLIENSDGGEEAYHKRYMEGDVLGEGEFGQVRLVHDMTQNKNQNTPYASVSPPQTTRPFVSSAVSPH
jgi:hypothetical protein